MNQLIRYFRSIIIIIMIALYLAACTTNNKTDTPTKVDIIESNPKTPEKDIVEIPMEDTVEIFQPNKEDMPVSNEINTINDLQKNKHIIKDNPRINRFFKVNNDSNKINFTRENQLTWSLNTKDNEIEFIYENYDSDKKAIHTLPLNDHDNVFSINDKIIGINTNKGVSLIHYSSSFDNFYSHPLLLNEDFTKAIGKNVISFEYDSYKASADSEYQYLQLNFMECVEGKLTYLTAFNINDVNTYKVPIEGTLLDIKKLATNDFVAVIKLNDHKVRFQVINYKCEIKWSSDYSLEEGMEYIGLTISTYNSFNVFYKYSNMNESIMVQYNITCKQIQSTYKIPLSLEYISDQYNTSLLIGIDKNNTKRLYVCDRNFVILDQIDFGTNTMSKISHLLFNRTFTKEEIPKLIGRIEYDNETYFFEIELMMSESRNNLFNITEENKINIDSTNHINYIFNHNYVYSNFNSIIEITTFPTKPYFIANNILYHYANDLITKVREWNMDTDNIEIIELLNNCYAFYKDDQYLFTHSVLNNRQEEVFYNSMLEDEKKPLRVYLDKTNNDVLIKDLTSIYTLSYGEDKEIICNDNNNELELVGNISLYKNGSVIFAYDFNTFYSYDELNKEWVQSELHTNENIYVFNNAHGFVLYSHKQAYDYNKDTHKLTTIPIPEATSKYWYYKVENGKLMINNDYYYDSISKSFMPNKLIQPPIFEGVIDDKYYSHVLTNEMDNTLPEIVLYATPYVHYYFSDQEIKLIDYKVKDGIPYIIEHETNHLYKIEKNHLVKVFGSSIRTYDISSKYLVYTPYVSNEQLYLYYLADNYEEIIYDGPVDDIHIDDLHIYYRDLKDNNLYRYNIVTKEYMKLTESGDIYSVYYVKDTIIYYYEGKFHLMDKVNFEIKDSVEGDISVVDEKNNELIYTCSGITLIYNITTMKNVVISYDNTFFSIIDLLGNKAVVLYHDGPGELCVKNYKDSGNLESVFDINKFKMNEHYTIIDAGHMYGMQFYVYENATMKHHKLVDSMEDYNEDELWNGEDPVILYHDAESIYFQKLDETSKVGYHWIKYTPSTEEEEIIDDVDTKGLKRIVGIPRGA